MPATPTSIVNAQQLYTQRLRVYQMPAHSPGHEIVTSVVNPLWNHYANPATLADNLVQNFYQYGRQHGWTWGQESGINGAGGPEVMGFPLLRAAVTRTNCGGFNASVRQLAQKILGLPPTFTNQGATTADAFITAPNTDVIDSGWTGNVRTVTQNFAALRAFFFKGHSWNQMGGVHYDATTNRRGFGRAEDLYWCKLAHPPGGNQQAFSVTVLQANPIPGNPPYYVIRHPLLTEHFNLFPVASPTAVSRALIVGMPATIGPGQWSTLLLVAREHLPLAFRQAIHFP